MLSLSLFLAQPICLLVIQLFVAPPLRALMPSCLLLCVAPLPTVMCREYWISLWHCGQSITYLNPSMAVFFGKTFSPCYSIQNLCDSSSSMDSTSCRAFCWRERLFRPKEKGAFGAGFCQGSVALFSVLPKWWFVVQIWALNAFIVTPGSFFIYFVCIFRFCFVDYIALTYCFVDLPLTLHIFYHAFRC